MSTSISHLDGSSRSVSSNLLTRNPVVTFLLLTYAISWSILSPLLLGLDGLGLLPYSVPPGFVLLLIILSSFGPTFAALLMTAWIEGGAGVRRLLQQYGRWKVGTRWYLLVLVATPIALLGGAMFLRNPASWQGVAQEGWLILPGYLLNLAVLFFVGGPLGEESGWRGFALPRLQQQYGALTASLLLGIGWALWHLPNFFIPATSTWTGSLWVYVGIALALSVIHTWVYNGTRGSLLLVTLLHAAVDASTRFFLPSIFGEDRTAGNLAPLIGFGIWALLLILLTRNRLGSAGAKPVDQ